MLDRARPFLFPLLLALWGAALLAQNFLLLPVGWRLAPAALILLGAYLLWRGDWPASPKQDTERARLNERHFRLPRAESLSASLVIDSGPVDLRLQATTDKVPAGAATATATLLTGEYAAAPPTLNRHFQHATILLDRRPHAPFDWADWRLQLAPELPWQIEIRSWLGELRLDCGALLLESAACSSVFGALHFTPPPRASGLLILRNALGDLHIHTPPDRSCRVRIHDNRFTRVHTDPRRYVAREDGIFAAGSLAESAKPVMLDLHPGLGDVFLD